MCPQHPFSHLLVFLIHILPVNIRGNKPVKTARTTTLTTNIVSEGKKNYLEKKQANLIDNNLLNIEK